MKNLHKKYTILTVFTLLFASLMLQAIATASITHSQTLPVQEQQLLQKVSVPSIGVLYGYYQSTYNSHPMEVNVTVAPNETPSLAMYYQDWGSTNSLDKNFMNRLSAKGITPIVTWEPWNSSTDRETNATEFTPKAIASGKYDTFIRTWAKDAAAYKKPFFLRFAHEMNGNWYPWGDANGNTPEDYKNMWIHVHTIFQQEGANNVSWVWSPNNINHNGKLDSILTYYPGDKYVDWVAFSGFNWGTANDKTKWNNFDGIVTDVYTKLSTLNKPIMMAETSSISNGGDKTAWFEDLVTRLPQYSKIKAIVFFNQNYNNADFQLNSGMDYETFANEYLTNNPYYTPTATK